MYAAHLDGYIYRYYADHIFQSNSEKGMEKYAF